MALPLLAVALLALAAAPAPDAPDETVELPIREVTVFSDRARVTRRGEVKLRQGLSRVRLPLLPPTLDGQSVRLEAEGAAVKRLDVRLADLHEFPRAAAEELLRRLETQRDQQSALEAQLGNVDQERALLERLRPASQPFNDPRGQPVLLEVGGWRTALKFIDARIEADLEQHRALAAKLRALSKDVALSVGQAQQLASGNTGRPGYLIDALIEGRGGAAKLSLVYMAVGARWYPAYDVRFTPGTSMVELDFAGLVSQETGEDWVDASFVLSTAVPATTTALPKLLAWKIGDREQFIPTPVARPSPALPPPPFAPPQPVIPFARNDEELRAALVQAMSAPVKGKDKERMADSDAEETMAPPSPPPMTQYQPVKPSGPYEAPRRNQEQKKRAEKARPSEPSPDNAPRPSMAPSAAPAMESEVADTRMKEPSSGFFKKEQPESASLLIPRGWQMPAFAADLPAQLAGGYDFTYPSARPESVRSGGEARRVALHVAKFPATPVVKILPALKKQGYLVADVVNTSSRPLLQGSANLFVGADLQGQAVLPTTAVNEKATLPLGVDDAIRIERSVNVITRETGLLSKKDVTTYEVKIELMNPRKLPIEARVIDQVPLKASQNVEITFDKMDPWALHDKDEGTLEWHPILQPGVKQILSFSYTLTRPRNARMQQW